MGSARWSVADLQPIADSLLSDPISARLLSDRVYVFAVGVVAEKWGEPCPPVIVVEAAAPSQEHARRVLGEVTTAPVDVEIVGRAPFVAVAEPWARCEILGERELQVDYRTFSENRSLGVAVVEDDDRVTLTALEQTRSGGVKPLPVARSVVVRLDRPVGDREIVDGCESWEDA